jgi:toxoflavin synthase
MTDSGQYDSVVANVYAEAEEISSRRYAEFPTLLRELGPVAGADVLDLACGTGIYSRLLFHSGARHVTGVDRSSSMIEQARALTDPGLPVKYLLGDVAALPRLGEFDVVNASFLLNYAEDRRQLAAMCETITRHLRPGGRFAGTLPNSDYDFDPHRVLDARYGATFPPLADFRGGRSLADGDVLPMVLHLSTPLRIEQRFWTFASYREALQDSGLHDIDFVSWLPSQEGIQRFGAQYWQPWIDNPIAVVVTGQKE